MVLSKLAGNSDYTFNSWRPRPRELGDQLWWQWYLERNKPFDSFMQRQWDKLSAEEQRKAIGKLLNNIDNIPSHIIAKVKVEKVFDDAPEILKKILVWSLDDGSYNEDGSPKSKHAALAHHDIPERDKQQQERIKASKKWPPDTICNPVAALINSLVGEEGENSLLVKEKEMCQAASQFYANAFVVDKTKVNPETEEFFKRIITDCRVANSKLVNVAKMELFSLETLFARFSACLNSNSRKEMFAVSADLRHWFHQIPFPRQFRKYAGMKYSMERGVFKRVYPRAWPMGFAPAPGVAQAVTWAMLLARLEYKVVSEEATEQERKRLEVWNAEARQRRKELGMDLEQPFDEYPQWIPLQGGGAVFVLIDNIFVISSEEKVVKAWRSRIVNNTNRYLATLKQEHASDRVPLKDEFVDNRLEDVEFKKLRWGSETESIEFAGIRFSGKGRKVVKGIETVEALERSRTVRRDRSEARNEVSNNNMSNKESDDLSATLQQLLVWRPTFRQLARVMGQILWVLRVQGRPMIEIADFVGLYELTFPQHNQEWNSEINFEENDLDKLEVLRRYYVLARENNWEPHEKPLKSLQSLEPVFLATDAAGGTESGLGFVYGLEKDYVEVGRDQLPRHQFAAIVYGELLTVVHAMRSIFGGTSERSKTTPKLIMLAIDNMAALHMLHRNYSTQPQAREMLLEINNLLKNNNSRLVLFYVRSEENPADDPSRGKPVIKVKLEVLRKKFEKLTPLVKEELLRTSKVRILVKRLPVDILHGLEVELDKTEDWEKKQLIEQKDL